MAYVMTRYDTLDAAAVEYIQQTMMEYLRREFVDNTTSASEESCKHDRTEKQLPN